MTDTTGSAEMPKYKCHKIVHALEIAGITTNPDGSADILPARGGFGEFGVEEEYMTKHHPHVGGYYVVYEDGYKSFSPSKAFEAGYTRI